MSFVWAALTGGPVGWITFAATEVELSSLSVSSTINTERKKYIKFHKVENTQVLTFKSGRIESARS